MAKRLVRALEPYDPLFVDQPLLPEHSDALSEVAATTAVPLATGERFYSRWDFKPLLVDGAVAILQPDVSHVGGISELRRVASMAEAFDVYLILHRPLSPIAFAAGLQVAFGAPNVIMQEQSLGLHDPADSTGLAYLEDPDAFSFDDGFVELVDGPGLGIRVDEEYVAEQARYDVTWQNSVWRHRDGGVAEW